MVRIEVVDVFALQQSICVTPYNGKNQIENLFTIGVVEIRKVLVHNDLVSSGY